MINLNLDPGLITVPEIDFLDDLKKEKFISAAIQISDQIIEGKVNLTFTNKLLSAYANRLWGDNHFNSELGNYIDLLRKIIERGPREILDLQNEPVGRIEIDPHILSRWVSPENEKEWKKSLYICLTRSFPEEVCKSAITTWDRDEIPGHLTAEIPENNKSSRIPVLVTPCHWESVWIEELIWPSGLDSLRIDHYAKCEWREKGEELQRRKRISFTNSCWKEIGNEPDSNIQDLIVEAISRVAYNKPTGRQKLETLKGKKGIFRLRVKTRSPDVRLHLEISKTALLFVNYYNRKHDKGLK